MTNLTPVEDLFKKSSEHDIIHKGKTLKLFVEPCDLKCPKRGMVVAYVEDIEYDFEDPVTKQLYDRGTLPKQRAVCALHIHLNWFEKLMRLKLENKVRAGIEILKEEFEIAKKQRELAEGILKS